MLFQDYLDAVAARMREPDMASSNTRLQADLPYLTRDELTQVVIAGLNQVLREVRPDDWQGESNLAIQILTGGGTTGITTDNWSQMIVPTNLLKVLSASVDGHPTVFASLPSFLQSAGTGARYTNQFTIQDGLCLFIGTSITLTVLVEPSMTEWQTAQTPILPVGYDIRALDVMAKRVLIADYVPEWRA